MIGGGGAERRFRLLLEHLFSGGADGVSLRKSAVPVLGPNQRFDTLGWQNKADYAKAVLHLRKLLSTRTYDAVISLGLYPNFVLWVATRFLRNRPAVIMTEITRPYTESMRFTKPAVGRIRQILYRLSYGGADAIAANSEDGKREIVEHYRRNGEAVVRISNLMEADRLHALAGDSQGEHPGTASSPFRICMVTRLVAMKRVDTLLRAAHALGPAFDWTIDLVGDGPERAGVEALIDELAIRDRVIMHGWLENPYPIMKAADLTTLCSEYEGFSNTVIESMVLGTPVATSYCSQDARDMAAEGVALGFEVGDWQALCSHLARLQAKPEELRALRVRASVYASRHHVENAIGEYEALVRKAVAAREGDDRP